MVDVLQYTKYFDGWRTVFTCEILSISALFMPLVLPILDVCACRYCSVPSISIFDTEYTACWKKWENKTTNNVNALISTYCCSSFSHSQLLLFFLHFPFFLVVFSPFWIGYFPFGFVRVARWCALLTARRSDIDVLSFTFAIFVFFLPFFYITSELMELLYQWCNSW